MDSKKKFSRPHIVMLVTGSAAAGNMSPPASSTTCAKHLCIMNKTSLPAHEQ